MKLSLISKFIFIFLFLIINIKSIFKEKTNKPVDNRIKLQFPKSISSTAINSIKPSAFYFNNVIDLFKFKNKIKNNTVLIFEHSLYHQECTPGFTKYFLDLGYNVDIILDIFGRNAFCFFNLLENIRIFTFYGLSQFIAHSKEFQKVFKNYSYIVIESTEDPKKKLYEDLGILKMNNTIFVVHNSDYINTTGISTFSSQNRIWSIGNIKNTLYVNPHYFGDFKIRNKNNRTRFFITSTGYRNYENLILAAEKIKKDNLDFEVIVIGKGEAFSSKNISENLKTNFKFRYHVRFKELYEAVNSSDYIIINLYPNYKNNDLFKSKKVTGAAQLCLGFFKPALIHKSFAKFYNMSSENSFLFDNFNFYDIMREAILLKEQEYKKKQENLIKLSNILYKFSLDNIKKTLNSIL